MIIKCKAVLLDRMVITMAVSIGLFALLLFLAFPAIRGYLYFISMVLVFSSVMYIFYLNRFELLVIGIDGDEIQLNFVNNSVYKRKDMNLKSEQVVLKKDGEDLIFWIDGRQEAIVRKKAVKEADWDKLLNAFPAVD